LTPLSLYWKKKIYMQLKNSLLYIVLPSLFLFLTSCHPEVPSVSEDDTRSLEHWLDESRTKPVELISEEVKKGKTIVLAQDNLLRADTLDLMQALLPALYDMGIRKIGLFFLDSGEQDEIDSLILDAEDKTTAEKLLFSANAALGYVEYCDFIFYVQDFNHRLNDNEIPIRLLALGKNGSTSADLLSTDIEDNDLEHPAFLWIPAEDVRLLPDSQQENQIIISHHGPDEKSLRWDGLIESVCNNRDVRDCTFAFKTSDPPFAGWNKGGSDIGADIYIVTPFIYRSVEPIPDFITPESVPLALEFFPEIKMKKPPVWAAFRMNRINRKAANNYNRSMSNHL